MIRHNIGIALSLPLFCSCWFDTQRHPAPMIAADPALPSGSADLYPAGPEEVLVTRLADPVFARRPGEVSSFPVHYYSKQLRLNAGSWVFSGAGGRLEALYPEGSSVTLYGRGAGALGSSSRGAPIFYLHEVDRATLHLMEGEQVSLLGGAVLTADGGPIGLERVSGEVLRVTNRSLGPCRVAYREAVFQVDPAEVVDLPLLETGTAPLAEEQDFRSFRVGGDGQAFEVRGDVEAAVEAGSTLLRATGNHEVLGLGLRLRLDPGDEARLIELDVTAPGAEPVPPQTAPPGPK